ncbi:hypothetical protein C1645_171595 [Glomus cerebriforme]|uniref:Uncharacterized protein n=1 Tax=Glomus cerebriforme TaxID=658196 RepID=A0A397TNW6_9GLOM|nr:hypothetical protein C1645_171595 [Glomus cerebriforme]
MKLICFNCHRSWNYNCYFRCWHYCNTKCLVVFDETEVLLRTSFKEYNLNRSDWKKFYLEYEKGGEKEAVSFFIDLHKVLFAKELSQREKKLKTLLDKLLRASRKKDASKYLKNWLENPEINIIFSIYLKEQPKLCLLLIEAGFIITEDVLLSALKINLNNKSLFNSYFQVLSIMLKKFNLYNEKKQQLVYVINEKNQES